MVGRNEEIHDERTVTVQREEWEPGLRGVQRQSLRCNGVLSVGRRRTPRSYRRQRLNRPNGNRSTRRRHHGKNESSRPIVLAPCRLAKLK